MSGFPLQDSRPNAAKSLRRKVNSLQDEIQVNWLGVVTARLARGNTGCCDAGREIRLHNSSAFSLPACRLFSPTSQLFSFTPDGDASRDSRTIRLVDFGLATRPRSRPAGKIRYRDSSLRQALIVRAQIRTARRGSISKTGLCQCIPLRLIELYTEGFNRFVTTTIAPITSGWCDSCRTGFAPAGRHRLFAVH